MSAGIEEYRSRLRDALVTINQLKAKLETLTRARSEPIAIIGMACRFPGGGNTPERFSQALEAGLDAVTEVPPDRWAIDVATDDPMSRAIRWGAFIEHVDQFDAEFFGISPREATRLDPQQRLLLEVTWEALEAAGVIPPRLMGSRTGVFLGMMTNDYALVNANAGADQQDVYSVTGNGHSFPAGRLSYTLGLQGPSLVVDTACSSSLVATHLASHSLRTGECDLAIVGGVNLILSPETMEQIAKTRALSPDGRCKTFDATANGYVRGEGCGVLVLKRLADARRDKDPIVALIRGSAVNQDGRSTGLTTPNVLAQETLLRTALATSGVAPEEIGYVEAHGTGTPLGDPIEIDAMRAVFGTPRADGSVCIIGAVKTNIGHLEAGAGVASIIKTAQIFRRSMIPANGNFRTLNPRIDIDDTALVLATANKQWSRENKRRRAGVSSFGMSGTNAHVILEEAPEEASGPSSERVSSFLLPLSAAKTESLVALARSYAEWFAEANHAALSDVVYTASVRRTHHPHRLAIVARAREEFATLLGAFSRGEVPRGVVQGQAAPQNASGVVFVFSGQGSQWATMGMELLEHEPIFRATLEEIDTLLRRYVSFSLLAELRAPENESRLGETEIVQPALFAIQVGLAKLLESWGIQPGAAIGHSVGEIAAAHVAGMLSLEDAVRLVARRGQIMQKATGRGKMVWAALPADEVSKALSGLENELAIAAINDPKSVVLSGENTALDTVVAQLDERGVVTRPLRVNYAFHSPQMDPLARELVASLDALQAKSGAIPLFSTVTGTRIDGERLTTDYWGRNVRSTVNFAGAVRSALQDGFCVFVEVGPHPVLLANLQECANTSNAHARFVPTLRRHEKERHAMLEALGALYVAGVDVDWEKLQAPDGRVVALPTYPWHRQRHWIDGPTFKSKNISDRSGLDELLYSIAWRPKPAPNTRPTPRASGGAWLIFMDRAGLGNDLCAHLQRSGATCIRVEAGDSYAMLGKHHFRINISQPGDYEAVLQNAARDAPALGGVIHLFNIDAPDWEQTNGHALQEMRIRCIVSALHLARALVRQDWRDKPRLWLVSRGAIAVGQKARAVSVAQAPVWGLARTIMIEHPELDCTCVDLDASRDFDAAAALARQFESNATENQIALRRDGEFVARLVRAHVTDAIAANFSVREDATYLITGGLGGLGLSVAQWLVLAGARHVALMGRRGPSEATQKAIATMEDSGANVVVLQCDVSSAEALSTALRTIRERMPELRGIVHAAGVVEDRTILELTADQVERVFAPKVDGAWNLHSLTLDQKLDFFVLYSSVASLIGSPGQGNYAAANAFLDALAHARAAMGLAGTSIHWGPFTEVGMAAAHQNRGERIANRGIEGLSPDEGNHALQRLLERPRTEVGVLRFDLRQWLDFFPQLAGQPFWSEIGGKPTRDAPETTATSSLRATLEASPHAERASILEEHLRTQLGHILQVDPSRIDRKAPFRTLGVDSLMSLELRNRLERTIGAKLPATLLFTYPHIEALTPFLLVEGGFSAVPQSETVVAAKSAVVVHDDDCIAIIGQACRFPGGGSDPEAFWRALLDGVDAVREVMPARWRLGTIAETHSGAKYAALLDGIDKFDAAFFGISPREAEALDPQQRMLLEVSWEALENAGLPPDQLVGSKTGVFVGVTALDYQRVVLSHPEHLDAYGATGTMLSTAAGRVSYVLGLQGPAVALDTACSSSLVAIHLARQSILNGESDLAIAGGVNALFSWENMVMLSAMRALSPDGRCKTLDARANGYVRGEGCGMVVLKRYSDAMRDGDRILALIRGSAMNQDGRSTGLTAPNVLAQQALLRQALENARLAPEDIGYIEMHGTGTPLGDPIEADALRAIFGSPRADGSSCVLGAVKTNIGHLESAAGVAGLIKIIQSFRHEVVPANLHFRALNPRISMDGTPFAIPAEPRPWPRGNKRRRAGVSSFGMSGTNAHIILEEAPAQRSVTDIEQVSWHMLPLSAKTPQALSAMAQSYADWFVNTKDVALHDIIFTASARRSHHEHRLATIARTHEEFAEMLAAFARGDVTSGMARGPTKPPDDARIVYVFSGQGSQWATMSRQLDKDEPVFHAKLEEIDLLLRQYVPWSLHDELLAKEDGSRLGETVIAQPAIFAVQVALGALFESWGITPHAVIGHSVGEIAAAHISGSLSLAEAVRLVVLRGKIMQKATGNGKMAWAALSAKEATQVIAGREDELSIGAINDPSSVVLSGETRALDAVVAELGRRGVATRPLRVNYAFHSPQMTPLASELVAALGSIEMARGVLPMYSSVTGHRLAENDLDAAYWGHNVRDTVNFAAAVDAALGDGYRTFLEMAPHPVLLANLQQCASAKNVDALMVPTLRRQGDERRSLLEALGALWAEGLKVNWQKLLGERGQVVTLPAYAWQRERYWIEEANAHVREAPPARDPLDDLLYSVTWHKHEIKERATAFSRPGSAWLVFTDDSGVGEKLGASFDARNIDWIHVRAGNKYERRGSTFYTLDPQKVEHYRSLLREAFPEGRDCLGIVYLFALDHGAPESTTEETLQRDQIRGFWGATCFVQALLRHGWRDKPPLWLVTRGAVPAGGAAVSSPAQAPLWGLGRTLTIEYPELRCVCIDLNPTIHEDEARHFARELETADGESSVALRSDGRYVARLERTRIVEAASNVRLREHATYLITGGLGGLGLSVAQWLVESGARHIVLVGRQAPSHEARLAIHKMEATGARIRIMQGDVTRRADVSSLFQAISEDGPPLRGIIHAAGVPGKTVPLSELGKDEFDSVIAAKVYGAWHLHDLSRGSSLDFFILYSSASALLGLVGRASYAAANAFLDAMALWRQGQGLPCTSIQWGAFASVGMARRQDAQERLSESGLSGLAPEQGLHALARLIAHPQPNIVVMHFSLRQWLDVFPHLSDAPLFRELQGRTDGAIPVPAAAVEYPMQQRLATAAPKDRPEMVEAHVRHLLGRVLKLPPDRIGRLAPFQTLGVDSLLSLEVRNRLESEFGVRLPATLLFTYANLADLSKSLLDLMGPVGATQDESPSASVSNETDVPDDVANATGADLFDLLDAELALADKGV